MKWWVLVHFYDVNCLVLVLVAVLRTFNRATHLTHNFLDLCPHFTMTETLPVYFPFEEGGLDNGEAFWRENYQFLLDHGYQLRPRYSPDWVPSWIGTNKHRRNFEDGIYLAVSSYTLLLKSTNLLFFLSVSKSVTRSTSQLAPWWI